MNRFLCRTLIKSINYGKGPYVVFFRPDFHYNYDGFPEFEKYVDAWTRGNFYNQTGDLPRLYALYLNVVQVMRYQVPGDFVELGVYKGNTSKILSMHSQPLGRKLYLYDTFKGFSEEEIAKYKLEEKKLTFSDTSLDYVKDFVGEANTVYVQGHFPQSITNDHDLPEKIAFVSLDCDLYEPAKAGLELFYPKLSPGGMICIHDYASGHWPGIMQAVDEFLADKPEKIVLFPDKAGTAILIRNT